MKNINKRKVNIDPIAEARKGEYFEKYLREAQDRIILGVEIYNMREYLSMTQEELARKASTTQKVVSRVENGDVNIGFALLRRIADILNFNHENWGNVLGFDIPIHIMFASKETENKREGEIKNSSTAPCDEAISRYLINN